jgi:hypothetical protein
MSTSRVGEQDSQCVGNGLHEWHVRVGRQRIAFVAALRRRRVGWLNVTDDSRKDCTDARGIWKGEHREESDGQFQEVKVDTRRNLKRK